MKTYILTDILQWIWIVYLAVWISKKQDKIERS